MPAEYIPIFIFALIVAAVPAVAFGLARRASGGRDDPAASSATVHEPLTLDETERRSNASQIFLVGVLFVVCDSAIIFLALWAARLGELGAYGLAAIAGFLGALACGYIWFYKKRAMERL